ncbi:MAG: DUF5690 family protein [Planctomyces sp.]
MAAIDAGEGRRQSAAWTIWALSAAFGTYFCMYAFRKPFTAATYADATVAGIGLKTVLVTAQVAGYSLSKFIGIKVVSEMQPERRAKTLIALVVFSELSLILFGIVPTPWNVIFMFLNGLPLGMVFGLVMGFLEGRRVTELLTAGLCASFIVADGATKSAGALLLTAGVPEHWMPAVAGAIFLLPLIGFVSVLSSIPAPSATDRRERSDRLPMTSTDRWNLARRYGYGLAALVLMYLMVTILRSLRADFAAEIWQGLGEPAAPSQFTISETLIALGVIVINGCLVLVRDNRRAFQISLFTSLAGFMLLLAVSALQRRGLSPFQFMVMTGLGLYLPYVAVHATLFERLLAMTRDRGNVGFLLYVADSVGYAGYVACILFKEVIQPRGSFLPFFLTAVQMTALLSIGCVIFSALFFLSQKRRNYVG